MMFREEKHYWRKIKEGSLDKVKTRLEEIDALREKYAKFEELEKAMNGESEENAFFLLNCDERTVLMFDSRNEKEVMTPLLESLKRETRRKIIKLTKEIREITEEFVYKEPEEETKEEYEEPFTPKKKVVRKKT